MIDLDRYRRKDGNEATNAEGLEADKENMTNEEKAKEIAKGFAFPNTENAAAMQMAEWKDEQFKQLLLTELKQWKNGNFSEAKYRVEMLNELIDKLNN